MSSSLLSPLKVGRFELRNRALMAPLTRCRSDEQHLPNSLMAKYYSQRASAGLIVTECTMIEPNLSAFATEPGIYSADQIQAWKETTQAVHAQGGKIFMQIWHAGRAAHPAYNQGVMPVAPSAIAIDGSVYTASGKTPYVQPQALSNEQIKNIVSSFAQAAKNAIEAGFDGVEVHGANGYLIDEFLRTSANTRTDEYGGSLENRARFLLEVLSAVTQAIGNDRVGLRSSPLNSYNSMKDEDPLKLTRYLAEKLNALNLAYWHLMRADFSQQQHGDVMSIARAHYKGVLIGNMGYTPEEAETAISKGLVDAVAFGTGFLANPDLPARIAAKAPLTPPDVNTFYSAGEKGYTDYPTL